AAQLRELCSIHRVRFSLRAGAFFGQIMVHDLGSKPSLSRSIFPIARAKVFATRLHSRMNLGPRSSWCTPLISDTSIPQKALRSTTFPACERLLEKVPSAKCES